MSEDDWDFAVRRYLFETWRQTALRYGFSEYDGPPLEPLELYTLKSGEEIVGQLYHFEDKGGRALSLRPEMTPTVARMVAARQRQYRKPIKWFSIPQLFRYERQQKGRLREHFQLNADIFGEDSVAADAELIALMIDVLRALGLTSEDFKVRLSSRQAWQDFFASHGGKAEQEYAFFQVIDKLERTAREDSARLLDGLGISLESVESFISEGKPTESLAMLLEDLQSRGLRDFVKVDYGVIRGLAYYTGTVFEAFDARGEHRAIAGGGRYDALIGLVTGGKVQMGGLGFGMGDVVLTLLLKERGLLPKPEPTVQAVVWIEEESERARCLRLVQQARDAGCRVDFSLTPMKADKQVRRALDLGAIWLVRPGQDENTVVLRDLFNREECTLAREEAFLKIKRIPAPDEGSK